MNTQPLHPLQITLGAVFGVAAAMWLPSLLWALGAGVVALLIGRRFALVFACGFLGAVAFWFLYGLRLAQIAGGN